MFMSVVVALAATYCISIYIRDWFCAIEYNLYISNRNLDYDDDSDDAMIIP